VCQTAVEWRGDATVCVCVCVFTGVCQTAVEWRG